MMTEIPERLDRFELRRELGSGAFGTVWAAMDTERNELVALKILKKISPTILYRFKQEFRALADLVNPNLIVLHELLCVDDVWFYTMEFVEGMNFRRFIRGEELPVPGDSMALATADYRMPTTDLTSSRGDVSQAFLVDRGAPIAGFDEPRLRSAMTQLCMGLIALHAEQKLHCDLKPHNVLVTEDGRVVILDFGLVSEIGGADSQGEGGGQILGTPAYMSPEQVTGFALGPPSDWYSVGVMLFEALTGRRPHLGTAVEILAAKSSIDPPHPKQIDPSVPSDLADLAMSLLHRVPEERPTGQHIIDRLGGNQPRVSVRPGPPGAGARKGTLLVGRERQVDQLRNAFDTSASRVPTRVMVTGPSGFGKSALVGNFLETLRYEVPRLILLRGRCYEQESVPYKALDSLIDSLTREFLSARTPEVVSNLPPNVAALARLFPVLLRVPAIAKLARTAVIASEPQELRKQAFQAFRQVLCALASRYPLVMFIDDLQWGDLDSAYFLRDLFDPPNTAPLLLILSFRAEDQESNEVLNILRNPTRVPGVHTELRDLAVGPLENAEAAALALAIMEASDDASKQRADAIAKEALGSPYYVHELVRYASEGLLDTASTATADSRIRLDAVLAQRVQRLSPSAQMLLRTLAVAGVPIPLEILQGASDVTADFREAIALLRNKHLIRTHGMRSRDRVESYHDRVRETVVRTMAPDLLVQQHKRLGVALENSGRADPEALATHFGAAGETEKALKYTVLAANKAAQALAFARAASFYRQALNLKPDPSSVLILNTKLGDALANAGRGPEAAEAYLAAVKAVANHKPSEPTSANPADLTLYHQSAPEITLELQRRASDQYLRAGHVDKGMALVESVLASVGLKLAKTPFRALLSMLYRRILIKIRGLGYQIREEATIPREELKRLDICWSAAGPLSMIDNIRGADFTGRSLLMALDVGEPVRLATIMAFETVHSATGGVAAWPQTEKLMNTTRQLADRTDDPLADGMAHTAKGSAYYFVGRFRESAAAYERAEVVLRDKCFGHAHELASVRRMHINDLAWLGEFKILSLRVPTLLAEALDRGNLYAATNYRLGMANMGWLVIDDPNEAKRMIEEASARWSSSGFHLQHMDALIANVNRSLYCGDVTGAYSHVNEQWKPLTSSMLLRLQTYRVQALYFRGRCALGAAAAMSKGQERDRLIAGALISARRLEKENVPFSGALSELMRATAAHLTGNQDAALESIAMAIQGFDEKDLPLHAAVARRIHGRMIGGDEGQAIIKKGEDWLANQMVHNPQGWSNMLVPGFNV